MKILGLVAHPDDASIFCGGTLAKHSSRGDDVTVVYLTRGELGGSSDMSRSKVADCRSKEVREAADVIGMSVSFLDFQDGQIEYTLENRLLINEQIRIYRPDIILTHTRCDNHPDHRITARLVQDAYYHASQPLAESDRDPVSVRNIYRFGKPTLDFSPDTYVNISTYQEKKEEAIRCHESQMKFLKEHGGIDRSFNDPMEGIRAEARSYGRCVGVTYAEGFQPLQKQANDYLE